jgi:hypothetical protein
LPIRLRECAETNLQRFCGGRFAFPQQISGIKTLLARGLLIASLKHEANLEALNNELVGVVRETMQPAHVFFVAATRHGYEQERNPRLSKGAPSRVLTPRGRRQHAPPRAIVILTTP